jgi:hypothetical protein
MAKTKSHNLVMPGDVFQSPTNTLNAAPVFVYIMSDVRIEGATCHEKRIILGVRGLVEQKFTGSLLNNDFVYEVESSR